MKLVSTKSDVHVALDDFGGPGVYARTSASIDTPATVNVRVKMANDGQRRRDLRGPGGARGCGGTNGRRRAHDRCARGEGPRGEPPGLERRRAAPLAGRSRTVSLHASGGRARLPRRRRRPRLSEVRHPPDGLRPRPRVLAQWPGRCRLHGVAMHQDYLGKGWAIAEQDTDASLALVKEIGANTIRLAHYPHAQHTLQRADEMGLVVWAEVPFVNGVRLSCANEQATSEFSANVEQQLRELIRQQFNHPSIGMWSIGNENTMTQGRCGGADNVTPVSATPPARWRRPRTLAAYDAGRSEPGRAGRREDPGQRHHRHLGAEPLLHVVLRRLDSLARDVDGLHAKYPNAAGGNQRVRRRRGAQRSHGQPARRAAHAVRHARQARVPA